MLKIGSFSVEQKLNCVINSQYNFLLREYHRNLDGYSLSELFDLKTEAFS